MESLTFPEISDTLRVTISVGVAEHSPLALIDTTLRLTDGRLYQAKQTGRNTVVWHS
jgi:PleD family two-component response regulator